MKYLTSLIIIFPVIWSVSFSQDTTWVDLPGAYVHINYQNSDYGIGLGDESSLGIISAPTWADVDFQTDPTDWITYVNISGMPEQVHLGLNELVIGWYEWNYETGETDLWIVYVFSIPVNYPCCNDAASCNYYPGWCEDEHCLYEVMCFVDPCENTTCENYPDAECVPDYCGGCFADFFVDGIPVDCALPPENDVFLTWEYPDTVTAGSTGNLMVLSLENAMSVGGIQFQLSVDPVESIEITQVDPTDHLGLLTLNWGYNEANGFYSFIIFDMLNLISPGEGPILEIYFDTVLSEGDFQVNIQNMMVSDNMGNELNPMLPDPPVITIDPCLPGDVNLDQEINILDIVATVNCIIENFENQCLCADVNYDGLVNILDVVLMVNIVIEGSAQTDVLNIQYGSAWNCVFAVDGWCYCEYSFDVSESETMMTATNWCGHPEITAAGTISSSDWNELLNLVDRDYFLSLDDAYGSMGGDDSNYEWITIEFEDVTKMVGFTYSLDMWDELSELEPLQNLLVTLASQNYGEIRCNATPEIGPCDGLCPRYFYNQQTQQCEMFMWGCCNGVVPFDTLEECEETCY